MGAIAMAFSRFANDYDRWFDEHSDVYTGQVALLQRHLPKGPGEMLEIGTGSGRFASRLGIRHGIDPSPRLIAMAKGRGLEPVLGAGEFLPYRDGTFDGILMMTVICFMDDVTLAFQEAFRVLRPKGFLVVAFLEKEGEIARREERSEGRLFRYARFYSEPEVAGALAGAGFSQARVRERREGLCVISAEKR